MSTNQPPVRRHSPAVYRRRRLIVLLGVIAVIAAIVLIIVRPGASQGEERAADSATAPTDTSATSSPPSADSAGTGTTSCRPDQLTIEAVTDKTEYPEGEHPELSVTITNTGGSPCTLNAGTAAQVFTVTSGDEVYWTSTDCQTSPSDAEITLEPGDPISSSVPIIWDRTRSSTDTCDGPREAVPADGASYHLDVTVDGIPSTTSKQFMLF